MHVGYVALRIDSKSIITSPFSNTHFLTLHTTDTDSGFNKALVSEVPIYAGPIIHPTVHVWPRLGYRARTRSSYIFDRYTTVTWFIFSCRFPPSPPSYFLTVLYILVQCMLSLCMTCLYLTLVYIFCCSASKDLY